MADSQIEISIITQIIVIIFKANTIMIMLKLPIIWLLLQFTDLRNLNANHIIIKHPSSAVTYTSQVQEIKECN